MENHAPVITLKELKEALERLEQQFDLTPETKVFLDTGWDSIQEINPDALSVEEAKSFAIEDPVSKELYGGYALKGKATVTKAKGASEKVLVIRNLY